jgi:hypothetical protein
MMASREQVLAGLRKARLNKYAYFGMGLGCFTLAVLLVVLFFARKHDWGALILAPIGVFFGVVMLYQFKSRSREVAALEQMLDDGDYDDEDSDGVAPATVDGPDEVFAPTPTAERHAGDEDEYDSDAEDGTDEP